MPSYVLRDFKQKGILDSDEGIWLESADGTTRRQILCKDGFNAYRNPQLSPDGTKVLGENPYRHGMWVLDLDGKKLAYLDGDSKDSVVFAPGVVGWAVGVTAKWSPDSRQIVYMVSAEDGHTVITTDLFLINADGTGRMRLTNTPDVLEAYLEQVRFFCVKQFALEDVLRSIYQEYLPCPFESALIDGCIDRGQGYRWWTYPARLPSHPVAVGTTNVADSLASIKKFVFDEKKVSMRDLIDVLDRNWEGHEELRQMMLRAPKFGNDDDYVDMIAREVHHRTEQVVEEFTDNCEAGYHLDGSGVSATYGMSLDTPATPDGRKDGGLFADATLSPEPGADFKGPTAVLKSCSKIDTLQSFNQLLNQKFLPQFLEGENKELFYHLLRTWADLGISHIQFNVVDKDTLLDAQKHPESHKGLMVRVAGYSAYFTDLSKGLQDHIIARVEQNLH